MQQQSLVKEFRCSKHPSEPIVKVDIDSFDHPIYCVDCILSASKNLDPSKMIGISTFIELSFTQYEAYRQISSIASNCVTPIIDEVRQNEQSYIENLRDHIEQEKQKVREAYRKIGEVILSLLNIKQNETLQELDKQLQNLRFNCNFYKAQYDKIFNRVAQNRSYPDRNTILQRVNSCNDTLAFGTVISDILKDIYPIEKDLITKVNFLREDIISWATALKNQVRVEPPICYFKSSNEVEEFLSKLKNAVQPLIDGIPNVISDIQKFDGSTILNSEQDALIRTWLKPSIKKLLYRGSRDGFDASIFHRNCDNHNITLTIVRSEHGKVFGGYSDVNWNHTGNYQQTNNSWLFSLDRKEKYPVKPANSGYAVFKNTNYGPTFGGHDLYISSNANTTRNSYSNFGHSYETGKVPQNEKQIALAGSYHFLVQEIEVFALKQL